MLFKPSFFYMHSYTSQLRRTSSQKYPLKSEQPAVDLFLTPDQLLTRHELEPTPSTPR